MKKCLIKKSHALLGVFLLIATGYVSAMKNEKGLTWEKPLGIVSCCFDRYINEKDVLGSLTIVIKAARFYNEKNNEGWGDQFVLDADSLLKFMKLVRESSFYIKKEKIKSFEEVVRKSLKFYGPSEKACANAIIRKMRKQHQEGEKLCILGNVEGEASLSNKVADLVSCRSQKRNALVELCSKCKVSTDIVMDNFFAGREKAKNLENELTVLRTFCVKREAQNIFNGGIRKFLWKGN